MQPKWAVETQNYAKILLSQALNKSGCLHSGGLNITDGELQHALSLAPVLRLTTVCFLGVDISHPSITLLFSE